MKQGFALAAMVVQTILPAGAAPALPASCPDSPVEFAVVADIGSDLSLTLEDGRIVTLAGIEPPRVTKGAPARPQDVQARILAELRGQAVGLAPLAPAGRWGSIPALVFAGDGTLAGVLLARGDVRMRPDRVAHPCRAALLAAEERARATRRGVWADDALAAIDADGEPPRDAVEGMAVIEGTVVSAGETPARLYLNLGRARGGFAISLPKRDIALMRSDVVTKARIKGTRVRVRGLVDHFAGWRVDVSDADAIEILPPVAADTASGAR